VIAVVDYGMGNRRSVEKALEHVGASVRVTHEHDELRAAAGLVIPGVGAFPKAMATLVQLGLSELIEARVLAGVPLLGICLGMQLLLERSEEIEPTAGLGLIPGEVTRLSAGELPVPHVGWSHVELTAPSPLSDHLPPSGCAFYHVHSFAARPEDDSSVLGATEYGERFASIIGREHVFGVQFHPEKSGAAGLAMLENFVALCAEQQPAAART
jgi:imidazole glycerol-phosphate synthase subunit HisH